MQRELVLEFLLCREFQEGTLCPASDERSVSSLIRLINKSSGDHVAFSQTAHLRSVRLGQRAASRLFLHSKDWTLCPPACWGVLWSVPQFHSNKKMIPTETTFSLVYSLNSKDTSKKDHLYPGAQINRI